MSDLNKAVVRQLYEAINSGDLGIFDTVVADSFVEHEETPGLSPDREGVKAFFTMVLGAFPDFRMDIELILAEDDLVSALVVATGTHKGEFMGIPATEKSVSVNVSDLFRIQDGKVAEHWGVMDSASMMQQLGVGAA
ncbi:MAG: ester cyclase [Dehalococcoidia bacterium]